MLTASVTFALAAALIVLLPGPDTLVVLRNLVRGGRRRAALTVAGLHCGLTVWVTAPSLGLAVLLLIHDRDVTVSDAATGEVIACHHIDPARDYQAPLR